MMKQDIEEKIDSEKEPHPLFRILALPWGYFLFHILPKSFRINDFDFLIVSAVLLFGLTIISVGLFLKNKSWKILLFSMAITVVLHLLFFPFVYFKMLQANPVCFLIDNEIFTNQKKSANNEILKAYNPENLETSITIISKLRGSTQEVLDSKLSILNDNHLAPVDSFFISKQIEEYFLNRPRVRENLAIFNKAGEIKYVYRRPMGQDYFDEGITIRKFLDQQYKINLDSLNKYKYLYGNINTNNKIWKFQTLWPYAIALFNTETFKPSSGLAHFVITLHWLIVILLFVNIVFPKFIETAFNSKGGQ